MDVTSSRDRDRLGVTCFSLAVIAHPDNTTNPDTDRFVLVHEKGGRGWWLPGGGVDAGQTLQEAAVREAEEEAGCLIELSGILRIDFSCPAQQRLRVIFLATPKLDQSAGVVVVPPLKSEADHHSRGAQWVTLQQCTAVHDQELWKTDRERFPKDTCHLRGREPLEWFEYVSKGGLVCPLSTLESVRIGPAPSAIDGDGEAPRAHYPTTFEVEVQLMPTHSAASDGTAAVVGGSASRDGGGHVKMLPIVKCNRMCTPLNAAKEAAQEVGFHSGSVRKGRTVQMGEITGLLKVVHTLEVEDSEELSHTARLKFIYGGIVSSGGRAVDTVISVGSYVFVDGGSGLGSGARRARVEADAGGGTWDMYYTDDGKGEFAVPSSRLTVTSGGDDAGGGGTGGFEQSLQPLQLIANEDAPPCQTQPSTAGK